jgi:hypothetical protein
LDDLVISQGVGSVTGERVDDGHGGMAFSNESRSRYEAELMVAELACKTNRRSYILQAPKGCLPKDHMIEYST